MSEEKVHLEETKWPDSVPTDEESYIISIVCGSSELKWTFHKGIKEELEPALIWR